MDRSAERCYSIETDETEKREMRHIRHGKVVDYRQEGGDTPLDQALKN